MTTGQRLAPYTGTVATDPGKVDIDPMMPLGNAHPSGAWNWPAANGNAAATTSTTQTLDPDTAGGNLWKGAHGPEDLNPEDRAYRRQYAVD